MSFSEEEVKAYGYRIDDKTMKKFVLYTAIFGEPGRFTFPEVSSKNVDRFCFTDFDIAEGCHQEIPVRKGRFVQNDFYEIKKMNISDMLPIKKNRMVKILIPDELFDNYEYSVYVDCKRPKRVDFGAFLKSLKPGSDFMTREHKMRDCVYYEGEYVANKERTHPVLKAEIEKQLVFYKKMKYPAHNGLYNNSILFRRHTEKMKEFSLLWWKQIEKYSYRDQVSLPYVAWKHKVKISTYTRVGRKKE